MSNSYLSPDGEAIERFSWEEGYDWEFYYSIQVYRNGVLFTASGEPGRGIGEQSEFQLFEQQGGIQYPQFMSKGGAYFQFERWLNEWQAMGG